MSTNASEAHLDTIRCPKCSQALSRTTGIWLSFDHRSCRARRRNRIRVSMNKLPTAVLQPKQACHAHCYGDEFLSTADFASPPFHLDNTGEIAGGIALVHGYSRKSVISM